MPAISLPILPMWGGGRKNRRESSVSRSDRLAQTDMCYHTKLNTIEHDGDLNSVTCPDYLVLQGQLGLIGWLKVFAERDPDLLCCAVCLRWGRFG